MRTEIKRTFDIPLKKGFDYFDDFRLWPTWYAGVTSLIEPDTGAWLEAGDQVRFAYRLLGRELECLAVLDERIDYELVRFHTDTPALPTFQWTYRYAPIDADSFEMTVIMETEPPTTFFGKSIDKLLLPRIVGRDLDRSLENIQDIIAAGMVD